VAAADVPEVLTRQHHLWVESRVLDAASGAFKGGLRPHRALQNTAFGLTDRRAGTHVRRARLARLRELVGADGAVLGRRRLLCGLIELGKGRRLRVRCFATDRFGARC
jgi:hypothetical protein